MKNLKLTKPIALLLSGLMITGSFAFSASAADLTTSATNSETSVVSKSISEVTELLNATAYSTYIDNYAEMPKAKSSVTIDALNYDAALTTAAVKKDTYGGVQALYTPETGTVGYKVNIPADGLYAIDMEYFPIAGKASNIERALRIDGKIPFKESRYLSMTKNWIFDLSDVGETTTVFKQDPDGNDVRPSSIDSPVW
ncbi:MAG: hypothetical protein MJ175_12955, partial [Clostridia bacterium]|nr:hypothetical protein [Clostridia bacterium]